MAEACSVIDTPAGLLDPSRYPELAARDGAQFSGGQTISGVHNESPWYPVSGAIDVPYLTDPLSVGARFDTLPGASGPTQVPWTGGWPTLGAFRLKLVAGPAGTAPKPPSAGDPHLIVTLPKADVVTVRFNSYLDDKGVAKFTLLQSWVDPSKRAALSSMVRDGGHWMFTPWRELVLVHAVRQPLLAPTFKGLDGPKLHPGDTFAALRGTVVLSLKSTGKLALRAQWDEWRDVGDHPDIPTPVGDSPLTLVLAPDEAGGDAQPLGSSPHADAKHEFHDTKHRFVYYEAVATTRFPEYFMEHKTVVLNGTSATTIDGVGIVAGHETVRLHVPDSPPPAPNPPDTFADRAEAVRAADAAKRTVYSVDKDYRVDEKAGTIARIDGSRIPDGATVDVGYLTPPVTRSSLEIPESPPSPRGHRVNVLSSARPLPPDIREVVPTFSWSHHGSDGKQSSARKVAGVRVYLGRGWWSSGEGELLGVVAAAQPGKQPVAVQPYVTMWGRDPAWNTGVVGYGPRAKDLPLGVATGYSKLLANAETVGVVGHKVQFDHDRGLWWADIDFKGKIKDSYFPFIRLALCRYQPHSMPGLEISPVVLADYIQLAPDRVAVISPVTYKGKLAHHQRHVRIAVAGRSFAVGQQGPRTAVTVDVQRRIEGTPQDAGWESTGPVVSLQRAQSAGVTHYQGIVGLPPAGKSQLRLVIRELEQYPVPHRGLARRGTAVPERVVYLDTFEV
jgi:hypothetical protein